MIVKWDMADYSDVTEYHIYANFSDGSRKFMGGLYGDTFYIKSLYGEDEKVTLELRAVGKDGSESDAATAVYNYDSAVHGVVVDEKNTANNNKLQSTYAGYLSVSWENPAIDYSGIELTVTPAKYFDYKMRAKFIRRPMARRYFCSD